MEHDARDDRGLTDAAAVPGVGLCAVCRHSRRVVSGKASVFWLCERSREDARFRKYPALPVVRCVGFEAVSG
jgi:hypothetical protein